MRFVNRKKFASAPTSELAPIPFWAIERWVATTPKLLRRSMSRLIRSALKFVEIAPVDGWSSVWMFSAPML